LLFNSLAFAMFLPVVLCLYYLLNHRWQNVMLMAASLFFYACWDWRFLFLLLVTVFGDFFIAAYLDQLRERGAHESRRKWILGISMALNLVILGFFKYFNFFTQSLHDLLATFGWQTNIHTLNIILPVGISFYTFQSMSYTIDVYRGELKACRHIWDFALFVSFFPHLVAGPIMRAVDLLPQIIQPRRPTKQQWVDGIHLIVWGFWKKAFIADRLAVVVNTVFTASNPSGFQTAVALYAFAWQIYCDFSGYTDIARGVAKLMGFELTLNFNLPYFATSPREFWSRWHISLSNWLRNYLYIPLGGNRGRTSTIYRNLILTMVLGGLWHGAAWNFVLWGAYQGGLLVADRMLKPWLDKLFDAKGKFGRGLSLAVRIGGMFILTCYGWLLFRAQSFQQIATMTASLASPFAGYDGELLKTVLLFSTPLLLIQIFQYMSGKLNFLEFKWMAPEVRVAAYTVLAYLVVFRAAQPQSFIYFQF
jgi:alginate O-acetyltransferase complex protein AlgI